MDVTAFREAWPALRSTSLPLEPNSWLLHIPNDCLLYTSDAADE
mgnify:CR=1 FL=1